MLLLSSPPTLIFGGASIGDAYNTVSAVSDLLSTLQTLGIHRIDTAARYPSPRPGTSELLLGEVSAAKQGFAIDTKIIPLGDGSGSLAPQAVGRSLDGSYQRLKLGEDANVNVLYCHCPDPQTPLEEQAGGLDAQFRRGLFKQLGISNFSPEMLQDFLTICDRHGFIKPSVYQGQYNVLCRDVEKDLLPILRRHGIAFVAFSPLAGGFLTGRLTTGDVAGTRFSDGNVMGQYLRVQYDRHEMHTAVKALQDALKREGIGNVEACLRWICWHSALREGDGIILGASRLEQLNKNCEAVKRGPLPESIVQVMDALGNMEESS
ncbi:uncharacterized protein K452DRAFT_351175 [Aplosporella prunicola CBS 121167]|uniref:NADP-dependent oxidoreductase domain-containing protein n=1 Tax=Aplosporella prunicola CBS 121167 TaxID=1176127 RepID=A0A6A6BFA4_9PEZI|nr:uncharacterized protein K452DRAFT_351175 [Aplosporella prunicola CBS 121167]KAF2141587.1 hypothetical protein K452DRAFT_351175 [Aplosporella prunicola CBS 121167]